MGIILAVLDGGGLDANVSTDIVTANAVAMRPLG